MLNAWMYQGYRCFNPCGRCWTIAISATSSGGRSIAPAITNAIAVCSPWYEPPPTRKNCATAAPPARTAKGKSSGHAGEEGDVEELGAGRRAARQRRHRRRGRREDDTEQVGPGAAREAVARLALAQPGVGCVLHARFRLV